MRSATPAQSSRPELDHHLDHDGERLLEPNHAGQGDVEGVVLVLPGVRGVVGADHVDGAVSQGGADGVDVLVGAQWRVHLEGGVETLHLAGAQIQVVRRHLGGHRDAARLRPADHLDTLGGRHVTDV